MFCSGCGTQIQSGLVYCSRCGRRVADDEANMRSFASNPIALTAVVAAVGFFAFALVLRMLTRSEFPPTLFVPITAIYFSALFGISFMLLRYGSKIAASTEQQSRSDDAAYESAPLYVNPATTGQLTEGRPSDIGSVTDATTRTLDKVRAGKR